MASRDLIGRSRLDHRRRISEYVATFGLICICVALIVPFFSPLKMAYVCGFKWIYGTGALVFTVARAINANDPDDSLRMKRLHRMEFWAGVAFIAGAAFWFYQEKHMGDFAGVLAVLRDTIMFTLAGALIQIIAAFMIISRGKKEEEDYLRQKNNEKNSHRRSR